MPLAIQTERTLASGVRVTESELIVSLRDGRTISVPVAWYPRLENGTSIERNHWRLIGRGSGIHWPDLDEDIEIEGLLLGERSGEGAKSFARWLSYRAKGELPPVPTFPLPADEA